MSMKEFVFYQPTYYKTFGCIGPDCSDNCCHSWVVTVDKAHYLQYKAVQDPDFQKMCKYGLVRTKQGGNEQDYARMALRTDGRCLFQDEDGGCHIYRVLGPGSLCHTCTVYPRMEHQFLPGRWERSLSLSCEEAARLALLNGSIVFETIPHTVDFADAEDRRLAAAPSVGGQHAGEMQAAREGCISVMQLHSRPLPERILSIGLLLRRVDRLGAENKLSELPAMVQEHCAQTEQGAFAGLFDKMSYSRQAHLWALTLPAQHLVKAMRRPVLRRVWEQLMPLCTIENSKVTVGPEALEFLLQQAAQKADPFLQSHTQEIENYFVNYIFSTLFPLTYGRSGLSPAYHGVLLAEQYALLRILFALLDRQEGESEEQWLVRVVVALARVTQHSDLGNNVHRIGQENQLDSLAYASYLLR